LDEFQDVSWYVISELDIPPPQFSISTLALMGREVHELFCGEDKSGSRVKIFPFNISDTNDRES
jgi:hypothetical protein